MNRLQEVSWDLLPLGNQGGLQGEPKGVGKPLPLEQNPAWLEGGQRQPLGNLRRTPRHLHLRQEGNSAGVHWHCQNWNPEGAHQHHQEWNPEGGRWDLQTVRFGWSLGEDKYRIAQLYDISDTGLLSRLVSCAGHKDHNECRSNENPCDTVTLSAEKTANPCDTTTLSPNSLASQENPPTSTPLPGHNPRWKGSGGALG